MNSMDALQMRQHTTHLSPAEAGGADVRARPLYSALRAPARYAPEQERASVARIANQRLSRPEQQHQENAEQAEHGEHRLGQDQPGNIGPEAGGDALDPGPKRRLA